MKSKKIIKYLGFANTLLAFLMVYATIEKKGWAYGALAMIVSIWLASGPVAYIKNWSIPLFGPFAYDNGKRQLARLGAVFVMTLMLGMLTVHELLGD